MTPQGLHSLGDSSPLPTCPIFLPFITRRGPRLQGVEGRPPVLCRRVLTGSLIIAASLRAKNVRTGRPALRGAELWSLLVGGPAERPSYAQGSAVGVGRDVINTQA